MSDIKPDFSFEDLDVWQHARNIRIRMSEIVKKFPLEEKYRLCDQIIRSSRSVTANIAEGYGRFHYKENIRFCCQARGSLFELIDHLTVAFDEKYLSFNEYESLKNDCYKIIKKLNSYIKYLKNQLRKTE